MKKKGAFTLVEMLFATAVFLLFCLGAYRLFIGGTRSTTVGLWYSKCSKELRNGLRLISEDLSKASYPSVVSNTGTDIDKTVKIVAVTGKTDLPGSSELLVWHICKPQVDVAGVSHPAVDVTCRLVAEGTSLRYIREGGDNPMNRVIVTDVDYVDIQTEASTIDADKNLIHIEIGTVHPRFEQSTVVEKTTAKVEVGVSS